MKTNLPPSPPAAAFAVLAALAIATASATAAPIDLNFQGRVTSVCEVTDFGVECAAVTGVTVPILVSYDPAALLVSDVGTGWHLEELSASVAVGHPLLPNPFGGPTATATGGFAFFSHNGPGHLEFQEGGVVTTETFSEEVCGDEFCGVNFWVATASIGNSRIGTRAFLSTPVAADFETFLAHGQFALENWAVFYDPDTDSEEYVIGSRWFTGSVPEPPSALLLGSASALAACRNWRRRRRSMRT